MKKNLGPFERVVRLLLGAFFLWAAYALYHHPLARLAAAAFGLLALGEAVMGKCWLHARLGGAEPGKPLAKEKLFLLGILGTQAVVAYEWWSAGWEKISSPEFVQGITGTLGFFASKNPFPWYKAFLEGFAMKNATAFAYAVEWGQVLIALGLAAAVIVHVYAKDMRLHRLALAVTVLALLGGMLMNANFYLAAGWTGPNTKGSNVVMFWTQAVLAYVRMSELLRKKYS